MEKKDYKKYVRYSDGAERYSLSKHTFMKLASEANALRKIGGVTLVNTEIFDEYIESFKM